MHRCQTAIISHKNNLLRWHFTNVAIVLGTVYAIHPHTKFMIKLFAPPIRTNGRAISALRKATHIIYPVGIVDRGTVRPGQLALIVVDQSDPR